MNSLQQLLTQIDRFRSMHKAGLTPSAADLGDFFDLSADVRGDLANGHIVVEVPKALSASSGSPADALTLDRVHVRLVMELVDDKGHVRLREPAALRMDTRADGGRA